jgi:hypothetical protein
MIVMFTNNDKKSRLPLAALCLNDAVSGVTEARYALHEAFAHLVWYRQECPNKPNEPAAIFFGRFYAVCVASCLYASGERLAEAIIAMLSIDTSKLPKGVSSRQSKLARYLKEQLPMEDITTAVESLGTSSDWRKARTLRDRWVHEQPLLLGQLGVEYKRRDDWIEVDTADGHVTCDLGWGGGDTPEYSIDDALSIVGRAFKQFLSLFDHIVRSFERRLQLTSGA